MVYLSKDICAISLSFAIFAQTWWFCPSRISLAFLMKEIKQRYEYSLQLNKSSIADDTDIHAGSNGEKYLKIWCNII